VNWWITFNIWHSLSLKAEVLFSNIILSVNRVVDMSVLWLVTDFWLQGLEFVLWVVHGGICDGKSGSWLGFPQSPLFFPCQCDSTAAPYSLVYHLGD
jgi:hypothetical protein